MRNVILGVVRKSLQTYSIKKSYSAAYYFDITKLLYCRNFELGTKDHVFLLSCENKTYCSYICQKYESFDNLTLLSTSTSNVRLWSAVPWGICHTSAIQKRKFQQLKVQKFSWFWVRSFRCTHECEHQKTNSAFVVY